MTIPGCFLFSQCTVLKDKHVLPLPHTAKGTSMSASDSQWIPALLSSLVYETFFSRFHVLSLRKCYGGFDDPVSKGKIIQSLFLTCSPLRKSHKVADLRNNKLMVWRQSHQEASVASPAPASFSTCPGECQVARSRGTLGYGFQPQQSQ